MVAQPRPTPQGRPDGLATSSAVSGILTPHRVTARIPMRGHRAVMSIDRQMVEDIWKADPAWRVEGVRVNDLSPLWPYSHARKVLLKAAQRMVRDLAKKGRVLLTAEDDVRVWGPFESPNWRAASNNTAKSMTARGRTGDEQYGGDTVDFLFLGDFLSTQAFLTDTRPQRPTWAQDEQAQGKAA